MKKENMPKDTLNIDAADKSTLSANATASTNTNASTNTTASVLAKSNTRANTSINALIVLVITVLLLGAAGSTYAYYTSTENINNGLITQGSEVYLAERFSPNDRWLPGETKDKEVHFGNQYNLDQVIRFKVTTEWFDDSGTPLDPSDDTPWIYTGSYTPSPATLNWTTEITGPGATWTQIGGYYYYNKVLEKGSLASPTTTPPVLASVTFSPALSNDTGHAEDFSNKVCRITVHMESLDVDTTVTNAAWGVNFTGSGAALSWS